MDLSTSGEGNLGPPGCLSSGSSQLEVAIEEGLVPAHPAVSTDSKCDPAPSRTPGIVSSFFSTLTVLWSLHEKLKDKQTQLHGRVPFTMAAAYSINLPSKLQLVHFIART